VTADLTSEQKLLVDTVRAFARDRIAPIAAEHDESGEFPWNTVVIEELAKVDASHSITVGAHTSLAASPIYDFGNVEQKERYLPPMALGESLGAFGLTEATSGSDAANMATTATRDGDDWILNGTKVFITNAGVAGTLVVAAVTDPEADHRGVSMFIVEADADGVAAGKKEDKLGWRASDTRELIFENVCVPHENLLGEEGRGFHQCLHTLNGGRIGIAAHARPANTRSRGNSSGDRSRSFRRSSSSWPTWPPASRPDATSRIIQPASRTPASHTVWLPRRPSSFAPSLQCEQPSRRSRSTAPTATLGIIRSSA
jgi:alkylation response protein AidB-like acyl-CoA dehydrogenase